MVIADLASEMITNVRTQGECPVHIAVSPDVYTLWQQQNDGVEPFRILGVPICIRENFKPGTMLILGDQVEEPMKGQITLDEVMGKIECGDYCSDAEARALVRLALRNDTEAEPDNSKIMNEFYESLERGRERFTADALQAVGLDTHPHATDIFAFADKMAGGEIDGDFTKCASILRRVAGFIHAH